MEGRADIPDGLGALKMGVSWHDVVAAVASQ